MYVARKSRGRPRGHKDPRARRIRNDKWTRPQKPRDPKRPKGKKGRGKMRSWMCLTEFRDTPQDGHANTVVFDDFRVDLRDATRNFPTTRTLASCGTFQSGPGDGTRADDARWGRKCDVSDDAREGRGNGCWRRKEGQKARGPIKRHARFQ